MKMGIRLTFLFVLLWSSIAAQDSLSLNYEGIGILPVLKGNIVTIKVDTAYIITTFVHDLGKDALNLLRKGSCYKLRDSLNQKGELQKKHIKKLSNDFDKTLKEKDRILTNTKADVAELQRINELQSEEIKNIKQLNEDSSVLLTEQKKKTINRTITFIATTVTGIVLLITTN